MLKTRSGRVLLGVALGGLAVCLVFHHERAAFGQGKAESLPSDLQRVPRDAVLFVRIRVGDLWNHPDLKKARDRSLEESADIVEQFKSALGVGPEELDRVTFVVSAVPFTQPAFVVRTTRPYARKDVLAKAAPGAEEKKSSGHTLWVRERGLSFHFIDDRTFLAGPTGELEAILDKLDRKTEGPLGPALERAAGDETVAAGLNVAAIVRTAPTELPPDLAPFKALLQAESATLVAEFGETIRARAEAVFSKKSDAKDAGDVIGALKTLGRAGLSTILTQLRRDEKANAALILLAQLGEEALKGGKVVRDGTRVRVEVSAKVDLAQLSAALERAVRQLRLTAARLRSQNNLKQLALAMHNYHDAHGAFPPAAVCDKAGKPLLSWRVLLLPYVEADALYRQFHLDEPWDSAHNKKLLAKMPPVFQHPAAKPGTDTHYLAITGRGTLFDGKLGKKLFDIADGTSNTLMFVEAAEGVPWSKPDDLPFDPKKLPKLGGLFPEGVNVAFCDGSVHFLRQGIKDDVLRAQITISGGEVIPFDHP